MPEQDLNPAAAKFISSLVKSLQILCNGQVEFCESIELVGHINVRVDHKYKFDYIVDEHVSKEGEDSATTFLSNSYHSSPPSRQPKKKSSTTDLDHDIMFSEIPHNIHEKTRPPKDVHEPLVKSNDFCSDDTLVSGEENCPNFSVDVSSPKRQGNQVNQMVVKLEGDDDSNDCMVLPASPGDFEPVGEVTCEGFPSIGPSASFEESHVNQMGRTRKRRQPPEQCTPSEGVVPNVRSVDKEIQMHMGMTEAKAPSVDDEATNIAEKLTEPTEVSNPINDMKQLISRLASLCDMTVVQDELYMVASKNTAVKSEDIKAIKKKFLESFDKEKIKSIREILKMKKGRQRKLQLRSLLGETGLSNEQLQLLAHDTNARLKKISWRSLPEGSKKEVVLKEQKKSLRLKTYERQQKLLEMAEMLKRNQINESGIAIMSKTGGKKCVLNKSSVSVVSHITQQLSVGNITEITEALSGNTKKLLVQQDKSKDVMKLDYNRRTCVKKKMKQIIAKILDEVTDAGYRVIVITTVGSEVGSHSAELSVVPLKVDDFLPESKESDVKPELSEEDYAKQLEREQILEKQQANEEKMKEIELKLLRILTGAEDIFIPTRKRYSKGEPRPSDAERMKEYRKALKQDPEKYQMYKQKIVITKKRRCLSELVAKVKVNTAGPTVTVIPAVPVNEESQTMGSLVSMTQPVGGVTMHCPQVYDHPSSHQPTVSVVNVHHTTQYVGQVAGIHGTHQHQQPIAYGSEMDIVELIAATHSVQNQHYG